MAIDKARVRMVLRHAGRKRCSRRDEDTSSTLCVRAESGYRFTRKREYRIRFFFKIFAGEGLWGRTRQWELPHSERSSPGAASHRPSARRPLSDKYRDSPRDEGRDQCREGCRRPRSRSHAHQLGAAPRSRSRSHAQHVAAPRSRSHAHQLGAEAERTPAAARFGEIEIEISRPPARRRGGAYAGSRQIR